MRRKNIVRARRPRRPAETPGGATRRRPGAAQNSATGSRPAEPRGQAGRGPTVARGAGAERNPPAGRTASTAREAPAQRKGTREQLLEVAGQVFSEKGYAGATGKEICERSGANAAAVVYHFGGMENLYRAVVQEARTRLVPSEALAEAVARESDPKAKLTAFIGMLVQVLSAPVASTWALRLLSREIVHPNAIFDEMRNKEMRARASILQSIVSELTGLPADNPAVTRCCINIMAPFGILLLIGPQRVERTFPILSFGKEAVQENTRHMVEFALGGLAAISRYQNTR
jgi:TetR/AcrR family transcriptional regulator, regulator of cefoperazone and chloramphenicol sensitivity